MTLDISWPEVIVGALALTSAGQRALKWAWAHRQLVREVFNALEVLYANGTKDAKTVTGAVKSHVGRMTEDQGGTIRRVAEAASAFAESMNGGGTTTRRREELTRRQRVGKVLKGIARWLPVVGALLP